MDEAEYTIKMKRGYCHITADELIFSKEENVAEAERTPSIINQYGMFLYRAIFIVIMIVWARRDFLNEDYTTAGIFSLYALAAAIFLAVALTYSQAVIIPRNTIDHVTFRPSAPLLTRAFFTIYFTRRGKQRKRILILPGIFNGGTKATKKALETMRMAGLYEKSSENSDIIDAV